MFYAHNKSRGVLGVWESLHTQSILNVLRLYSSISLHFLSINVRLHVKTRHSGYTLDKNGTLWAPVLFKNLMRPQCCAFRGNYNNLKLSNLVNIFAHLASWAIMLLPNSVGGTKHLFSLRNSACSFLHSNLIHSFLLLSPFLFIINHAGVPDRLSSTKDWLEEQLWGQTDTQDGSHLKSRLAQ